MLFVFILLKKIKQMFLLKALLFVAMLYFSASRPQIENKEMHTAVELMQSNIPQHLCLF